MENFKPGLIPCPKYAVYRQEALAIMPIMEICDPTFTRPAKAFAGYAQRLVGVRFTEGRGASVVLRADPDMQPGEYSLRVQTARVVLSATDEQGMQYALATLGQLILVQDGRVSLPMCEIRDVPDCEHRCVMIDLARNWHPFDYLLSYVDLCWFYKISRLHLHFTDDQSYTLQSALYPKLATEGRSYSPEDIAYLNKYAAERGISLIPEIDVPGHCTPFCAAYPEIFGTDNIIPQTEEAMAAMQALFSELCDMFPNAEYVHVGGDEAAIEKWTTNEACRAYAESCGIDFDNPDKRCLAERMLANFVQKMADAVVSKGKRVMAWEGFAPSVNEFVSKDIIMHSWENYYQTAPQLLEGGFKIINSSWSPMYVVAPVAYWSQKEVYDWSVYRWRPVHPGSPYRGVTIEIPANQNVLGGQLLAWGDAIPGHFETVAEGIAEERRLVAERMAALSENTWNREKIRSYAEFAQAYEALCAAANILIG
ncbi:MAG: family 20 glycosylhydrolase [Clostridia bacterium]|nr:family 20 glycosylhydrolase [Clostridia bacterium]